MVNGFRGFHYDADLLLMNNVMVGGLLDGNGNLTTTMQLAWAIKCVNDLAEYKIEIPEPLTIALVSLESYSKEEFQKHYRGRFLRTGLFPSKPSY